MAFPSSHILLSLLTALLLASSCLGRSAKSNFKDQAIKPRLIEEVKPQFIVEGKPAHIEVQRRMALIWIHMKSGVSWHCSGSVMSKKFILSAAHCFFNEKVPSDVVDTNSRSYVLVGEATTKRRGGGSRPNKYMIKNVFIHKDYSRRELHNDVALVELEQEIADDLYFRMKIGGDLPESSGKEVTIAGYGWTSSAGILPDTVLQAQVLFQLPQVCDEHIGWQVTNEEKEFCMTSPEFPGEGGSAICHGDSGGPVMKKSAKHGEDIKQIGINSHYYGLGHPDFWRCEKAGNIQYAVRLSYYKKMIKRKVRENDNSGWKKI